MLFFDNIFLACLLLTPIPLKLKLISIVNFAKEENKHIVNHRKCWHNYTSAQFLRIIFALPWILFNKGEYWRPSMKKSFTVQLDANLKIFKNRSNCHSSYQRSSLIIVSPLLIRSTKIPLSFSVIVLEISKIVEQVVK